MDKRLTGKVAIITGAASGIGLACAKRFSNEGASVIGIDIQDGALFEAAVNGAPFHAFYQADVSDSKAQQVVIDATIKHCGRIDTLVTAAGIAKGGPVHTVEEAEWDNVININLKGTFLSCKAVLPQMMQQRSGSIITIASIEGIIGTEGGSSYNASKGGVVLLSKNIAIDYGRMGIRCNAICPGFTDTPMLRSVIDLEFMKDYKDHICHSTTLGRLGKPEEIAATAFFLASDDSTFVTGHSLVVDGGYTTGHMHGIVEMLGLV